MCVEVLAPGRLFGAAYIFRGPMLTCKIQGCFLAFEKIQALLQKREGTPEWTLTDAVSGDPLCKGPRSKGTLSGCKVYVAQACSSHSAPVEVVQGQGSPPQPPHGHTEVPHSFSELDSSKLDSSELDSSELESQLSNLCGGFHRFGLLRSPVTRRRRFWTLGPYHAHVSHNPSQPLARCYGRHM